MNFTNHLKVLLDSYYLKRIAKSTLLKNFTYFSLFFSFFTFLENIEIKDTVNFNKI
jgi:hypothetical protein